MNLPQLIVFDLDFTIWDCGGTWCDCLTPPFREERGCILDAQGRQIRVYPDIPDVLNGCNEQGILMAIASRTEQPTWARELLRRLQIADRFTFAEIYPSSKLRHFRALQEISGRTCEEMLFFDDEHRNIREVSQLGVTSILVEDGFTRDIFDAGLQQFHSDHA